MANKRYDLMELVPFDEVTSLTPGVIVKAGLRTNTTGSVYSEAVDYGLGIGGSDASSGHISYDATNGAQKDAGGGVGAGNGAMIAIPTKYQGSLHNRGSVQYEVNKSDLLASIANGSILMSFTNGASTNNGFRVQTSYTAPVGATGDGSSATYRTYTTGLGDTDGYPNAIGLLVGSSFDSVDAVINVMHDGTTANSDGCISIRECWDGFWLWTRVNGKVIARRRRKTNLTTQTATNLCVLQALKGVRVRNVLVMNTSGPDPQRLVNPFRTQLICHSFGQRAGMTQWQAELSQYWGNSVQGHTAFGFGTEQMIVPSLIRNSRNSLQVHNTSIGGMTTTWMKNQVDSTYDASELITANGCFFPAMQGGVTGANGTPRYRPHFAVAMGHTNDTSKATIKTNVAAFNAACVAKGVVPIWIKEQNGNLSSSAAFDHGANGTLYPGIAAGISEQCATDKITFGDVGYVDMWTPTGGDNVFAKYVQNSASLAAAVHPTWAAQDLYGIALAAEIDRLIASPPDYAWWK